MLTARPFSIKTFQTQETFKNVLDNLLHTNIIEFYAFIEHKPENIKDKKHTHLFIIPAKQINTNILNFNNSVAHIINFPSWYLLYSHNKAYISSLMQNFYKYEYRKEDFYKSDDIYFNETIKTNTKIKKFERLNNKYFQT